MLSLYDQAGGNGRVIGALEGEFELLGIVSQDWLHVRQVQADGAIVVGFVSALGTTWAMSSARLRIAKVNCVLLRELISTFHCFYLVSPVGIIICNFIFYIHTLSNLIFILVILLSILKLLYKVFN